MCCVWRAVSADQSRKEPSPERWSPCRTSPGCCAQSQPLPVEPPRVLGVAESIRAEVYPGLFTVLLAVMKPNWALLKFCCDI